MKLLFSMVSCAADTATFDVEAELVLEAIRNGNVSVEIERIQCEPDKKKREELKKHLPGVTWSGRFSQRDRDHLIQHSGLFCADLDSLNGDLPAVENKLKQSPYLFASFVSPSGNGLKAVFRVPADAAQHMGSFRAVEKHVREVTGRQIDQSGKDLARLCFLSSDPDLYFNPNARELAPLPQLEKRKIANNGAIDLSKRQCIAVDLLGQIDWQSEIHGFLDCPGKHLHTTGNAERDCEIHLDGAPTLHCFHNSCLGIVDGVNHELRSRIGKTEYAHVSDGAVDETAVIERLAALPVLEYERIRKMEAEKLNVRASTLDQLVSPLRPRDATGLQGAAVKLPDIEPWHEAVNGAEVLDQVAQAFERYVVMPSGAADGVALWCGHTHCYKVFQCSPRLNATAPEKNCGKTTLRDVVGVFVPHPLLTENLTTAVLFRLVDSQSPVILADEYDAWLSDNEELRGLLNAGHRGGAMVYRCEGDSNEVRGFAAYAPAMLCGIGALPGTLHDRSIVIRLERAKRGELKARFDSRHTEAEQELCRKLTRWCADNYTRIEACDPKLPDGVFNRMADNWRPLFAIADVAGGDWPQRCATAFAKLTSTDPDADGIRILLLEDIRQVFAAERMFSKDLIEQLAEMKERPWPEVCRGKPITERCLARNLAAFNIRPKLLRIGDCDPARGYEKADFEDAFARYLS